MAVWFAVANCTVTMFELALDSVTWNCAATVPALPSVIDASAIEIAGAGLTTVTVAVAWLAAPFGSVAVSTTVVTPIG